jgi:gamma-glutamyltranspeptidase / glutathione hydrolase
VNRTTTGHGGGRPMIQARREVVTSGHYLATQIGMDILARGGNAFDAAAGVAFALAVLKPHQNGIGGESPTLIYSAAGGETLELSGHGAAPRKATLDRFLGLGLETIPGDGLLPALAPPAPATWIALLLRFGTMRLADALSPAIELAEEGFAMYEALRATIAAQAERFRLQWPTSARVFLPGGNVPETGDVFRNPDWAATFRLLLRAEARYANREDGLRAARDAFYEGQIARQIAEFCRQSFLDASGRSHAGLLETDDLADCQPRFDPPARTEYRGVAVCKCGPWTQGPVLLQSLNLLEGYDLAAMGHNSADYIHTVVECMKLAFADREFYYADPLQAAVPMDRLLSKAYAAQRRRLVDPSRASMDLRPGGLSPIRAASVVDVNRAMSREAGGAGARGANGESLRPPGGDTTKLEVIDSRGNVVSATPSGGWLQSSPVIDGMGFPLGTRGQMFSLAASHPNVVAPGKRPRTTLTPSLAFRGGRPWMAFGSPGGDSQDQWALQFFLNVVEFGMPLQHAVEAATFTSAHAPSSFYPRLAEPGALAVEGRVGEDVRKELASRGHIVRPAADWSGGNTLAAAIDPATGMRQAAASPRMEPAYAAGR